MPCVHKRHIAYLKGDCDDDCDEGLIGSVDRFGELIDMVMQECPLGGSHQCITDGDALHENHECKCGRKWIQAPPPEVMEFLNGQGR
jgi:hypothetical protein